MTNLLYLKFTVRNDLQNVMRSEVVVLLFLSQTVCAAEETSAYSHSAFFTTWENKRLMGYVVEEFESASLISCGQLCMRNEWCTSTNFIMSSQKVTDGTCELNKHEISVINENAQFYDQCGVTFAIHEGKSSTGTTFRIP